MTNPTENGSAVTPAGGGRFVGMRRRVVRTVMGKVFCDECGNPFTEDSARTAASAAGDAPASKA